MGDSPVFFVEFCGEEAVVGNVSEFPEFIVDGFLETGFVADFVDELV